MAALLAHAAQMRALHATLQTLDPPMADALAAQTAGIVEADAVLRECGIQLASLRVCRAQAGLPAHDIDRLRNRIDALIAPLSHPLPVSQIGGD